MSYFRKATSQEVFNGSVDVMVTPDVLRENVWYFSGNTVGQETSLGTLDDYDIPIIRNNVEKLTIENAEWTTMSYISTLKVGSNGDEGVIRFPLNSSIQHGLLSETDGSFQFIMASGESSSAPILATPIIISSTGAVGIGNSPTTGFDVTGTLRFRAFSNVGYLLSVSSVNGNIIEIDPASLGIGSGTTDAFVQSGNTFGSLGILGTNDAFGLSIETNNTEAIRIDTSQFVGIGTSSPQQKLHLNSGLFRQEQTSISVDRNVYANVDVDATTEAIATVVGSTYVGAFYNYVIYNSGKTNMRAGTIQAVWNSSTVSYHDFSTVDIGDTSGVTMAVVIDELNVVLQATVTTNNWLIKVHATFIA